MQHGLTTRQHLRNQPTERPIVAEGYVCVPQEAEQRLRDALRAARPNRLHGMLPPRVIVAIRSSESDLIKGGWIQVLANAGATRVFLVPFALTCAIGLGIQVEQERALGLLALERDWMEYATIGLNFTLTESSHPVGVNDLLDEIRWHLADEHGVSATRPEVEQYLQRLGLHEKGELVAPAADGSAHEKKTAQIAEGELVAACDTSLRRFCARIHSDLMDLTDEQVAHLQHTGIRLCGDGSHIRGLPEALTARVGIAVTQPETAIHPAMLGLRVYAAHIDEWERVAVSTA